MALVLLRQGCCVADVMLPQLINVQPAQNLFKCIPLMLWSAMRLKLQLLAAEILGAGPGWQCLCEPCECQTGLQRPERQIRQVASCLTTSATSRQSQARSTCRHLSHCSSPQTHSHIKVNRPVQLHAKTFCLAYTVKKAHLLVQCCSLLHISNYASWNCVHCSPLRCESVCNLH